MEVLDESSASDWDWDFDWKDFEKEEEFDWKMFEDCLKVVVVLVGDHWDFYDDVD